jgi:AAA15 family ATPase/GTPase
MVVIEQIEIKNFRSFGNRTGETTKLVKIKALNILSGSNDSGKSNVLRALNLFFNGHTNLNSFFDSNVDFFNKEIPDDKDIKEELVTIKLWFSNENNINKNKNQPTKSYLPTKFWVSKKWKKSSVYNPESQKSNIELSFLKEKSKDDKEHFLDAEGSLKYPIKGSLQKQLTDFLTQIQFHYVPAIKDKLYFSHLFGELQQTLWKGQASRVDSKKNEFQKEIQTETSILMEEFKETLNQQSLNYEPVFQLPENLVDLFRTLQVQTGGVELTQRGDGVQAKLIPEILNYIAIKEKHLTNVTTRKGAQVKKYFIWGFEEPENSYEYKNAQLLANRFKDKFIDNAQVFITTHSFNFISIDGENISKYRVWQDDEISASRIAKIEKDKEGSYITDDTALSQSHKLNEELGVFSLNIELEKVFVETERIKAVLEEKMAKVEQKSNYLFVEDKYDQLYKIAWLKINNLEFDIHDFEGQFDEHCHFSILGLEGARGVGGVLRSKNANIFKTSKIVGLFDFDREGAENFYGLTNDKFWNKLPSEDKSKGHYRKRKDHKCMYGMLLPIPERLKHLADLKHENFASYIAIENLLPESFLQKNNYVNERVIVGTTYFKIKENSKDKLWKKAIDLSIESFNDFVPIFETFDSLISDE